MNCWEYKQCGKENSCKVANFELSDGFLGGKNGGKACIYIAGSFCNPVRHGISKKENCISCDFYKYLKKEHGNGMNVLAFIHFMETKQKHTLPLYEIHS